MLPLSLKIVWLVLSALGTICCWAVSIAFNQSVGSAWATISYCIALTVHQGMFCLGMIWRMDPFSMPRGFCVAQAILMHISSFGLMGIGITFSLATSVYILKPKSWGSADEAFKWRNIYIWPIIVFPLIFCIGDTFLVLWFDAIHPTHEMRCDVRDPLWVRYVAYIGPAGLLFLPAVYISVASTIRVVRTLSHFERAKRDDDGGRIQRTRHSGHHMRKIPPNPLLVSEPPAKSPSRQPLSPTFIQPESSRLNFHLPFLRQPKSTQTLAAPSPSPNHSINRWDDGVGSVASSNFPTFAPVEFDQDAYTRPQLDECDDIGDARPWLDEGGSSAPTSHEGHETLEALGLDVKDPEEADDGIQFTLSYREIPATSSAPRVSHINQIPTFTPAIYRLLGFQAALALTLLITFMGAIVDAATHRQEPTEFGVHNVAMLVAAWGPVVLFGDLPAVRAHLVFWR